MGVSDFIQSLPAPIFFFLLVAAALFTVVPLAHGLRDLRQVRSLRAAIRGTILEVSGVGVGKGGISVEGIASPLLSGPLYARLTGRPCCWYRYRIEKYVAASRTQQEPQWRLEEGGDSEDVPLLIMDESGTGVVWPLGAQITAPHRLLWYGDAPRPLEIPEAGSTFPEPSVKAYRYVEECILDEDHLHVLGGVISPPLDDEEDEQGDDDAAEMDEESHHDPVRAQDLPPDAIHVGLPGVRRQPLVITPGSESDLLASRGESVSGAFTMAALALASVVILALLRWGPW